MRNDPQDQENPTREFTGVWIPAEIMLDENLTAIERITYAEIASFREFYASNAWLANRIGKSEPTARRIIATLIEKGYIKRAGFNGRFRTLRAGRPIENEQDGQKRAGRVLKNEQADCAKMSTREQSIEQSIDASSKEEGRNAQDDEQAETKKTYGNETVNRLLDLFETETGIKATGIQQNRRAVYSLTRSRGEDGAEAIIKLAGTAMRSGDQYAPRIASPRDLVGKYEKASRLEAWSIKRKQEDKPIVIPGLDSSRATESTFRDDRDDQPLSDERIEQLRNIALGRK